MQEIQEMLKKVPIRKVSHIQGEFLSNIFTVRKKYVADRPVIDLKNLNQLILYQHFKIEHLHCLKFLLQENNFLCKIDLTR